MFARTIVFLLVVASLTTSTFAISCYSQSDCASANRFCFRSSSSYSFCQDCDACPTVLGQKDSDSNDRVVGGSCPSWCTCQSSSDCTSEQYCMKNKNGMNTCSTCSTCLDGASVEGVCPAKCRSYYGCTSHSDCGQGQGHYCNLAHQCVSCDMNCIIPAYTSSSAFPWSWSQVGPIDGVCPTTCNNLFNVPPRPKFYGDYMDGKTASATEVLFDALYHLPASGASTSSSKYQSGLAPYSANSAVTSKACTATPVRLMGRDVNKVVCADLSTAQTTCDDNKMTVQVDALNKITGYIQKSYTQSFSNGLFCAIKDIVVGIVTIILIIGGVCVGLCVCGCICCCYLSMRRRRQYVVVQNQNQPAAAPYGTMTPSNSNAPYHYGPVPSNQQALQQAPYQYAYPQQQQHAPVQGVPMQYSPTNANYTAAPPVGYPQTSPYQQAAQK